MSIYKHTTYFSTLMLVLGVLASVPAYTSAYFFDTEVLDMNTFSAGSLDLDLSEDTLAGMVGMEVDGELEETVDIHIAASGTAAQFEGFATSTSALCGEFDVHVEYDSSTVYSGSVADFALVATEDVGAYEFTFDIEVGAALTHGDTCTTDFMFRSWRSDEAVFSGSGFVDTEVLALALTAKTVVLNEVLAHPDAGSAAPDEFIEVVNNGNAAVDIDGWKVSEETGGGSENVYTITTAGGAYTADPGATTVLPAGGHIALYLSDSTALNNTGDTVRLYDASDAKLDEYIYATAKFGASDARDPDGTGAWVDPVPTPGLSNDIELVEEVVAAPVPPTTESVEDDAEEVATPGLPSVEESEEQDVEDEEGEDKQVSGSSEEESAGEESEEAEIAEMPEDSDALRDGAAEDDEESEEDIVSGSLSEDVDIKKEDEEAEQEELPQEELVADDEEEVVEEVPAPQTQEEANNENHEEV